MIFTYKKETVFTDPIEITNIFNDYFVNAIDFTCDCINQQVCNVNVVNEFSAEILTNPSFYSGEVVTVLSFKKNKCSSGMDEILSIGLKSAQKPVMSNSSSLNKLIFCIWYIP